MPDADEDRLRILFLMEPSKKRTLPNLALRIWRAPCCPYHVPWSMHAGAERKIQVTALRFWREARGEYTPRWDFLVETLFWPFVTALKSITMAFGVRGRIAQRHGSVGRVRQIFHQISLANLYNIRNDQYYGLRMYQDKDCIANAGHYLTSPPVDGLFHALHRDRCPASLRDKVDFHDHCARNNIPAVPIYAICRSDHIEYRYDREGKSEHCKRDIRRLPDKDLIIKPRNGSSGAGIELWRRQTRGWFRGGLTLSEAELIERCRVLAVDDDILITPRIVNSPDLSDLAPLGLATLRVVTCMDEGGEAWVLLTVLRMPVGEMPFDNFAQGGLAAGVDAEGRLLAATKKSGPPVWFDCHPDTGAQIKGRLLDGLKEARELCLRAHRSMPEVATVGWDAVLSDSGVMLLEGNSHWCTELAQIPFGVPLGQTLFASWAVRRLGL